MYVAPGSRKHAMPQTQGGSQDSFPSEEEQGATWQQWTAGSTTQSISVSC